MSKTGCLNGASEFRRCFLVHGVAEPHHSAVRPGWAGVVGPVLRMRKPRLQGYGHTAGSGRCWGQSLAFRTPATTLRLFSRSGATAIRWTVLEDQSFVGFFGVDIAIGSLLLASGIVTGQTGLTQCFHPEPLLPLSCCSSLIKMPLHPAAGVGG